MSISLQEFLDSIVRSGVMPADEVRTCIDRMAAEGEPQDADSFSEWMVAQGFLTRFQVQRICRSKRVVLGNYVLLEALGQGGMGRVYRARHRPMDRVVTLKVLRSRSLVFERVIGRFQREAKTLGNLTHINLVTTHDAGVIGGVHFLVMEYVDGSDLHTLVRKCGPLSVRGTIECITQAARGLEYAHTHQVIHRDIKPSNLMLQKDGIARGKPHYADRSQPGR